MKRIHPITTITAILLLCGMQYADAQWLTTPETRVFNSNFKSLQTYPANNEFAPPVIELGSDERLIVSFDEMSEDRKYLRYRVIHCNADWKPSQLVESEYLEGFNEGDVNDYAFSSATFAHYVNYRIVIPNVDFTFKVSGNYMLQVYPEDDPNDVILQTRFYVVEPIMDVSCMVSPITDIDSRRKHQQLEIAVSTRDKSLHSWTNDIEVHVEQNSRHDTEVVLNHPNLTERDCAIYQHDRRLIFPAGNEFRRFEVVATNYPGLNVAGIEHIEPYYHVDLYEDEPRADKNYIYDQTQFGRYKIRQSGANDSDSEADYVIVHFTLDMPQIRGGDIYIDGDFTQHNYSPSNRMRYDSSTGKYTASMMVKMGSYNYQYLYVPNNEKKGYTATIEGDHYPTVNEYLTRVYYRPVGSRYDRLVGYRVAY